ncbi:GNAT family N-acetyltransferase [Pseudomonas sp. NPDC007930]|uniref:GNAT family N-acetyltransferase n=1 Tax=Pseudomonas sp. NPDC007930 TaxID=3364417 RepID=UPI0036F16BF0
MPGTERIELGALQRDDLNAARDLVREAFAEVLGEAEPDEFWNDRDYVTCRWHAPHTQWFKAFSGSRLLGVACVARWGSQAIVGPLAVVPDHWENDIAQRLMAEVCAQIEAWGCAHSGLFTFPDSPRHLALYQKFGFWPGHLAAVMSRGVNRPAQPYHPAALAPARVKAHCREILETLVPGMDVDGEVEAVQRQQLGSMVLTADGFAICHHGEYCEAGSQAFYIRLAAIRPGGGAAQMAELLGRCEAMAWQQGAGHLLLGVNTARLQAYRWLLDSGFRTRILGVTLHNGPGYDRQDVWLLDDWR